LPPATGIEQRKCSGNRSFRGSGWRFLVCPGRFFLAALAATIFSVSCSSGGGNGLSANGVADDDDDASPADDDSSPDDDDNFTPHWSAVTIGQAGYLHHGAWGSSASDVYVVGDNGTILHYDGVAWTAANSGWTESWL
jgi:hypothetical protein